MASTPQFAATPVIASLSLAAVTACATRAPTPTASLAAANIFALTNASTNGLRIDAIEVQAASTAIGAATTAGLIQIWEWDGTSAFLIDEIAVTAVTPSATAAAFTTMKTYALPINLPAAHRLYAASTATTTAAANALSVTAYGGAY